MATLKPVLPTIGQPRNIFAITLTPRRGSEAKIQERIEEEYPDQNHFKISDICFLVSSYELSQSVAQRIGLKGENRVEDSLGVVFRLNGAYSGYHYKSVWEWIKQFEGEYV